MIENSKKFKCVVWDLDNTIWHGILLEDKEIKINQEIVEIIKILDKRGILHSIASRNDYELARKKLRQLELWDYFIFPEIDWNDKSILIEKIVKNINIDSSSIAFVDDQQFELEEVKSKFLNITTFLPKDVSTFVTSEAFTPRFITNESSIRRQLYQNDILRNKEEKMYSGSNIEFLNSLNLNLSIKRVTKDDLERAEELTIRTHQLNTTGISYTYEQLHEIMLSDNYELLCCSLNDKFGEYGTIGLTLIEKKGSIWLIKLLLISCRVMSRNVGNALIIYLTQRALKNNMALQAEYIQNEFNRSMYITYKFNSFEEIHRNQNYYLLEFKGNLPVLPKYINLRSDLEQ